MPVAQLLEYGVALAALVALAGFTALFVRSTVEDLRKQRDQAVAGWREQSAATTKLADALEDRNALIERLLAGRT